ncbi:serpentine type 7TM GPCR chemoreceptor srh domain-containing protein [Ditylenchus destructor]|nr:serpentine type 7TM GPCR chemoreceptor srh domain-containing protein [Ditylenchus destructor]
MSAYRYFLSIITVWDMIFTALLGFGLHPKLIFPMSAGVARGFIYAFGTTGARVLLCIIIYAAVNLLAGQAYCLMYRLSVIWENRKVHHIFMKPITLVLMQIFWQLLALAFSIPAYECFTNSERFREAYRTWGLPLPYISPDEVGLFMEYVPRTRTYAEFIVGGFVLSEILCFLIAYLIFRNLKKNSHHFSKKTYRIHLQLTLLLVIQLSLPFIFIVFPIGYALKAALTNDPLNEGAGDIGIIMLSLYATVNSFVTIIFVTPYRRYTKRKLLSVLSCGRCNKSISGISSEGSSQAKTQQRVSMRRSASVVVWSTA